MVDGTFVINKPTTLVVNCMPTSSVKMWRGNDLFYERLFALPVEQFFVNIPDLGTYKFQGVAVVEAKKMPLKIWKRITKLPTPERHGLDPEKVSITHDKSMPASGTPAKIYALRPVGAIHVSTKFLSFPFYIRKFMIFHEKGHRLYKTEQYCDLYASKRMLDAGYNESSCVYALTRALKRSPENISRIGFVLNNIIT